MGKKPPARHVVPHQGGWAVKRAGSDRASSVHDTQRQAIDQAVNQARGEQGQAVIHNRKGQIRDERTYRKDPFPPRG